MDAFCAARRMLGGANDDPSVLGGENALAFAQRVYAADPSLYLQKLKDLGFAGRGLVLDAGCGFGQWTVALAALNDAVIASDLDPSRTRFLRELCDVVPIRNVTVQTASLERLFVADNSVDAVFAYGVVFLAEAQQALREFARVLRPGGILYFNFPSVWWYAYIWEQRHNQTNDYDPRAVAASALRDSLNSSHGDSMGEPILDPKTVEDVLRHVGFSKACVFDEGSAVGDMGIAQSHAFGPRFGKYPSQLEVIAVRS